MPSSANLVAKLARRQCGYTGHSRPERKRIRSTLCSRACLLRKTPSFLPKNEASACFVLSVINKALTPAFVFGRPAAPPPRAAFVAVAQLSVGYLYYTFAFIIPNYPARSHVLKFATSHFCVKRYSYHHVIEFISARR
jgi:hypothetical protein